MGFHEKFIEEIVKASVSNDYLEAIMEWKVVSFHMGEAENNCICTHPIVQNCHVTNVLNGEHRIIGNCCIRKFFPEEEVDEAMSLRSELLRLTRDCLLCGTRYRKEGAKNDEVCDFCHEHNLKCSACNKYFECSDPEKRKWCKLCPPDWQKSKGMLVTFGRAVRTSKNKTKQCRGCFKRIPIEPSWKEYCRTCYFTKGCER